MQNFGFLLEAAGGGSLVSTIIMIVLVVLVFYFFMIRPQKKQEKKDSEMRDALAIGDEVTTIGGIIGKVISIKGETFVLETTKDKTKIRFLKGAIRSVDVKAADIAAAVIEGNKAEDSKESAEVAPELPVAEAEEPGAKKKSKKKKKAADESAAPAQEAAPVDEVEAAEAAEESSESAE